MNWKSRTHWNNGQFLAVISLLVSVLGFACGEQKASGPPKDVVIARRVEDIPAKIDEQLKQSIEYMLETGGRMNDSTHITNIRVLDKVYAATGYQPYWSESDHWLPAGDSLFFLISQSKKYGLFPADYHLVHLLAIRNQLVTDTLARKNVVLWTKADLLLSDAYLKMAAHMKMGHLEKDSITMRNDSLSDAQLAGLLQEVRSGTAIRSQLESLEPTHTGYRDLRAALKGFLDSASFKEYTYIDFPNDDSLALVAQVGKRLQEEGLLAADWNPADSAAYTAAIRKYQHLNGIRTTGVAAELTTQSLNNTDWEKFKRIVINLDRYRRQLPEIMPETYVWVNLPAYQLAVVQADTIVLRSKIIVGAPKTRTPVLNSEITNFITYPQWTVPYSIIFKEMIPRIRKDTGYLASQNLMVVDKYDSVINPSTVDWARMTRNNFPYLIRQRQGDDNSLGVMKFNFRNKYSVYLHDTNARSLFGRKERALSHGCVRVQEWANLSHFLVRDNEIRYHPDTLKAWIGRQEKHVISDFPRIPIFIRYFTTEVQDGGIRFFNDIYGDDRLLSERYFKSKPIS